MKLNNIEYFFFPLFFRLLNKGKKYIIIKKNHIKVFIYLYNFFLFIFYIIL